MANRLWTTLRLAGQAWQEDNASNWAAALAFYTMMSVGPLLFLAIALAGMVFGLEAAHGAMLHQVDQLMGAQAARALEEMVRAAPPPTGGFWRSVFGLGTLLFGASGVFVALQDAMDQIWHVRPKPSAGLRFTLKKRFLSASMVLGLGFLLMVSLALDGVLAAAWASIRGPGASLAPLVEFVASSLVGSGLLLGIFKVLPDVRLRWRTAMLGAGATAVLLNGGKTALGLYLGHSGVTDAYGAAGSLALILIWVYYAAQIVLFGAAFTRVVALQLGEDVRPTDEAVPVVTVPTTQRRADAATTKKK